MPSNDTANIYSTQYGGEGEPIPATKISYDNTNSGLTADDVQEAIDELAGNVDDIETFLDDEYVSGAFQSLSVTADGVKTYSDLIDEMYPLMQAVTNGLANNEVCVFETAYFGGVTTLNATRSSFYGKSTNINPYFERVAVSASGATITQAIFKTSVKQLSMWTVATGGNTYKDWLSTVPAADAKVTLTYKILKKA